MKLNLNEKVSESRSYSGRYIFEGEPIEVRPKIFYLKEAKRLWRNITRFPRNSILTSIQRTKKKLTIEELNTLFKPEIEKKPFQFQQNQQG